MKVEVLPAERIIGTEREKLRTLTFRGDSGLRTNLHRWGADPRAKVLRIADSDGKVLSWGLMVPWKVKHDKATWYLQLYTRADYRQQGLGTLIYRKAVQIARGKAKLHVCPHDDRSVNFFNKMTGKSK